MISIVAIVLLPTVPVAVPVKAGLAKGAYPVRLGSWLMVVRVCPPRVAVPVNFSGPDQGCICCQTGYLVNGGKGLPIQSDCACESGTGQGHVCCEAGYLKFG